MVMTEGRSERERREDCFIDIAKERKGSEVVFAGYSKGSARGCAAYLK